MKLPTFYLLDAISKNIYEPYTWQFAPSVIPLFLEANERVDQKFLPATNTFLIINFSPGSTILRGMSVQIGGKHGDDFVDSFGDVLQHLTDIYIYVSYVSFCFVLRLIKANITNPGTQPAFVTPADQ